VFLTTLVSYDFRADIDHLDLLKSLPLLPSRLVVGQLAAPVLLVSTLQLAVLTAAQAILGQAEVWFLLVAAAFLVPFNFLIFGLENLLFLLFPMRIMPATPGDFQLMGRHILLMLAKTIGLLAVLLAVALVSGMITLAARILGLGAGLTWAAALAAAWLVLVGIALGLVPLQVWAFQSFDVARDVPP
jgi:hypothetical protein